MGGVQGFWDPVMHGGVYVIRHTHVFFFLKRWELFWPVEHVREFYLVLKLKGRCSG